MAVSKPMMARIINKDLQEFKAISKKLMETYPDERGSYTQVNLIKEQLRILYALEKAKSN